MNSTKLNTIKKVLDDAVSKSLIAGANILIFQDGKEQYYCESGFADIEKQKPIERNSIFHLYSMTKPITSAAAMILLERGLIDLLDPVSNYIPSFKDTKIWNGENFVTPKNEITLKNLLGMVSGLPYGDTSSSHPVLKRVGEVFDDSSLTTLQFADQIAKCGILFEPGSSFAYGTSSDIMGAVIEVVSGMKFSEFLQKEIFEPLNMQDTGFWIPTEKADRLSQIYRCQDGTTKLYTDNHLDINNKPFSPPLFESGGAGLLSTIDDYMKFANMLLNHGLTHNGCSILSKKTVEYFTSPQLSPRQFKALEDWQGLAGYSYGNFMRVMVDPGQAVLNGSVGEYGWDGWLGTYHCNSPKDNLSFILMMQKVDAGTDAVTRRIRNICMSSL
ncbi:serine hydrolase domain-containing protein [Scatolibacter rhodanostii]|uniref:serine hydrolase domain-containing protein n=1 Tax=Scatolibacter rhodanostii TaxID=2014781 RepID=UPI000C07A5FD|nr:serine hydrolase domain-containing protein [Scatolibacter rhodanostii]